MPDAPQGFPTATVESLARDARGAIKIGPFGSQLRKEEMVDEGYKVYGQENVIAANWSVGDRRIRPSKFHSLSSCRLEPGDVVLTMMGTIGKCGVFPEDAEVGIMDSHLLRIQPDLEKVERTYLRVVIQAEHVVQRQIAQMSHGSIMAGLSSAIVRRLRLPVPPLPEQRRIAEILDTVDEAIRQTEEVIVKLKQVKQGLLHDLLTFGIDDNGELRDPGRHPEQFEDSALGRIPKSWGVEELRQLATLVTSGSRGWAGFYSTQGALFVRSQNVRMGFLDFSDRQYVSPPIGSEGQRTRLIPADLLITITGNSVGNVAFVPSDWNESAFVSQHVGLVRFADPPLAELAMNFLMRGSPGNRQLLDAQYGQSKPGLNLENLRALTIPVPPAPERIGIIERLTCAQQRIEAETSYARQLSALKAGLMEDLLTGRVRVTALLEEAAE